jgi:glycerate kinase
MRCRTPVVTSLPVADGGEGTASVICGAAGGDWHSCEVHDPLGTLVQARYCTIENGTAAVVEMSEASGLWRVPAAMRDPIAASSFGTGEMLLDAARRGVATIIIGLGGSATNDGGFGMARALGYRFLDRDGRELASDVSDLERLAQVEAPLRLELPAIVIAADVANPLLGSNGATRVFGPQKGATPEQLQVLERALERLADVAARDLGHDFRHARGSGAAGGLGFGLMTFCSATLRSGFEVVAERIGLAAAIAETDMVVTGEGRLDAQTLAGKAPAGVAKFARAAAKPVYAIAGAFDGSTAARELFDGVVTLVARGTSDADAMSNAPRLLRERARELALAFLCR